MEPTRISQVSQPIAAPLAPGMATESGQETPPAAQSTPVPIAKPAGLTAAHIGLIAQSVSDRVSVDIKYIETLISELRGVVTSAAVNAVPSGPTKTGYKTTEFWVAAYAALSPLAYQGFGIHLPSVDMIGQLIVAIGYIGSRTVVKRAASQSS